MECKHGKILYGNKCINCEREKSTETAQIEPLVILELWNHGTAGKTIKPCGEVDIFNISGSKIPSKLLEQLLDKKTYGNKFDWFGDLPTEQALKVEAEISCGEGDFWLSIKNWETLPELTWQSRDCHYLLMDFRLRGEDDMPYTPQEDAIKQLDLKAAAVEISNEVYRASSLFERLEEVGKVRGNGHHIRQEVAKFAENLMKERWVD